MNDFFDNDDDIYDGNQHTPLRKDAFKLSADEKVQKIEGLLVRLWKRLDWI